MFFPLLLLLFAWMFSLSSPIVLLPMGVVPSIDLPVSISTTQEKQPPISLLAVGDIMLDRYVETLIKKEGAEYPFAKIGALLENYDIVLGNLEGPVVEKRKQTPDNAMNFSFSPEYLSILKDNHFSILTLANNHTYDHGKEAFAETREQLKNAGLTPLGHPLEITSEHAVIKDIHGKRIGFLGFNATKLPFDRDQASLLVQEMNSQTDIVIVTIHWGNEYALKPNKLQKELAHIFVDSGADAVIGHHPHVVQSIEMYKDKMIFYSLGNFIFDQYFSTATQEELAVAMKIEEHKITYTLHPLRSKRSQPEPMQDKAAGDFLKSLADRSDPQLAASIASAILVTPL
ncbi:CapA family protein [Candidatus Gracilibacteria bacterium]|nr:CapA family protein [Candidatus Gracilibacteria bacterium]